MYILRLLPNIVTTRVAALGILENKFLYACVKEACELSHILTPSINSPLLLKHCDLRVGIQVVAAQSEIRAVRRVVKQLPVEMLQTVLECKQLYTEAHCHGRALYQTSAFHAFCSEWPYTVFSVFHNTLMTLSWSLLA
jgi:hypothetical protein